MFVGSSRAKRRSSYVSSGPTLARFSGGTISHPVLFGGGHSEALVGLREQTIAYGYAAVLEQFETLDSTARWCTLSVSLPNNVPFLVVDSTAVLGAPDVPPAKGWPVATGDFEFASAYVATAEDEDAGLYLLTAGLREVLLRRPVQRLAFAGPRMLVRVFDGSDVSNELVDWLHDTATQILQATPAFASRLRGTWTTFPPGITGPRI